MHEVRAYLARYKRSTNPFLKQFLQTQRIEAKRVGEVPGKVVTHVTKILAGGKRIRGALMCLGYELAGGKNKEIYRASLFLELFHAALLIHDDVIDRDEKRRGVRTIHSLWGDAMAINAGDLVFSWTVSHLFSSSFPADRLKRVASLFASSFTKTIYGQILDVSTGEPLDTIRLKTAEYTGVLPLIAGATLAGVTNTKTLDALTVYGRNLGMVFQIQDDILDENTLGNLVELRENYYQKGIRSIKGVTQIKSFLDILRSFLSLARNRKN